MPACEYDNFDQSVKLITSVQRSRMHEIRQIADADKQMKCRTEIRNGKMRELAHQKCLYSDTL